MNRLLLPLAWGFRCGVGLRALSYRRGWRKARRLGRPVVSIGNLSVGGTGKTPLVEAVAQIFIRNGLKPSILTRGYGRRDSGGLIALEPGIARSANPREVGDEPALLARALPSVPIVISDDRFLAGRVAEGIFKAEVHILDDGFQHFALERDLDIVTVDATQELSANALLPAGRLREPASALRRADIIVITRSDLGKETDVEAEIARIVPMTPVFQCCTRLDKLIEAGTGEVYSLDALLSGRVAAFCGIGNPCGFFGDLRKWGFEVTSEISRRDHHVYDARELEAMTLQAQRSKAAALLTTEKDVMNFPSGGLPCRNGLPVLACSIRAEIREPKGFEQAVLCVMETRRAPS